MVQTVSVIVPVYNCREYLNACIESVLAQTCPHIQLILVDDGSTDGSGEICDSFAAKDSRIQVIHQANSGVSAARNAGLDAMTGEYLLFVDGDDSLAPEAVETALRGFVSDEIGVTVFGFVKIGQEEERNMPMDTGICTGTEMLQSILTDYAGCGGGYPWNKMWRVTAFGSRNDIPRFDRELYYFEDLEWVVRMLLYVKKGNLLPEHLYRHYIRCGSITHRPGAQEWREIGYHRSVWKIIEALEPKAAVRDWFKFRYYPQIVNGVIHAWRHGYPKLRKLLLEKMVQTEREILCSDRISSKIKLRCRALSLLNKLHVL